MQLNNLFITMRILILINRHNHLGTMKDSRERRQLKMKMATLRGLEGCCQIHNFRARKMDRKGQVASMKMDLNKIGEII